MRISDKKIKLGFYAYYSIFALITFLVSAFAEQFLPTKLLVKSLLLFSLFVFVLGVGIYITNQVKRKPIIVFILAGMLIALVLLYITGDYEFFEADDIYNQNRTNMNKYLGTPYREGFELNNGIDDNGLIHATLWQTLIQEALINKNFSLMGYSCYVWWKCFDYEKYNNMPCIYKPLKISDNMEFITGDVIVVNNHSYVYYRYYKGMDIWMTSNNKVEKVYFSNRDYLKNVEKVYRVVKFEDMGKNK